MAQLALSASFEYLCYGYTAIIFLIFQRGIDFSRWNPRSETLVLITSTVVSKHDISPRGKTI